jgi:hypothetical protein
MYKFIRTQNPAFPFLGNLTRAYESLAAATDDALVAARDSSRARNELDGAQRAKSRSQKTIDTRKIAAHAAGVREQAVREPLLNAVSQMRSVLGQVEAIDPTDLPTWQNDALRINVICSVDLLAKALTTYRRLMPFAFAPRSEALAAQYKQAAGFAQALPELPVGTVSDSRHAKQSWDFMTRCLTAAMDHGSVCVSVDDVDTQVVRDVVLKLRKAGWHAEMQDPIEFAGCTIGLELNAPKGYRLPKKLEDA